jgi:hypothetical protein
MPVIPAWIYWVVGSYFGYKIGDPILDKIIEKMGLGEPEDIRMAKLQSRLATEETGKKRAAETQFRKEESAKDLAREAGDIRSESGQRQMALTALGGQQRQEAIPSGLSPLAMSDVPVGIREFLGM